MPKFSKKSEKSSNSKELIEELHKVFLVCEPNCKICDGLILKLIRHMRKSHTYPHETSRSQTRNTNPIINVNNQVEVVPSLSDTNTSGGSRASFSSTQIIIRESVNSIENQALVIPITTSSTTSTFPTTILTTSEIKMEKESEESGTYAKDYLDFDMAETETDHDLNDSLYTKPKPNFADFEGGEKQYSRNGEENHHKEVRKVKGNTIESDPNYAMTDNDDSNNSDQVLACKDVSFGLKKKSRKPVVPSGKILETCQICEKKYSCLTTHMRKAHKVYKNSNSITKASANVCNLCQKKCQNQKSLALHFEKSHPGIKPFICQCCQKGYSNERLLKLHIRSHTGEKPYACHICEKKFALNRVLGAHMKTHNEVKPHKCDTCGKGFRDKSSLTSHERTHTGEKPFTCELCGHGFRQTFELKIHMKIHNGELYTCETCGSKYKTRKGLRLHLAKHTGERPYMCDICSKCFAFPEHLKSHMVYHTGERSFVCEFCNKGFKSASNLYTHRKMHIGTKKIICEICGFRFQWQYRLNEHMRTHNKSKQQDTANMYAFQYAT